MALPVLSTRRVSPLPGARIRNHQWKLTESSLRASACILFFGINIMRRLLYWSFVYFNAPSLDFLTVCGCIQALLLNRLLFLVLFEPGLVPSSFFPICCKLFIFNWSIFLRLYSSFLALFIRLLRWCELRKISI